MYKAYNEQDFVDVADAIRQKTGKSAKLEFPDDFISEIEGISGGGSQNILGGTDQPTGAIGSDGDIYINYSLIIPPTGYTCVEYVATGSVAGAYINTDVYGGATKYFEIDFKFDSLSSSEKCIFGSWVSNKDTQLYSKSNDFGFSVGSSYYRSVADTNRHKILANSDGMFLGDLMIMSNPNWNNVPNTRYGLFCRSNGNNFDNYASNLRIYGCKIWDDDVMIRNFIPVVRNSDEAVGMYDLVNDTFYANNGTQQFIAGEELTGKPIDTAYLKVNGSWILLENGDWDNVNSIS